MEWMVEGSSQLTTSKCDVSHIGPSPSDSSMGTSTDEAQTGYSCAASSPTKGGNCCRTSTQEPAVITLPLGLSLASLSDKVFIGPRWSAKDIVHNCEGCQFYVWQTHLPTQALYHSPHLTLHGVGTRHGRTTEKGARGLHALARGNRQILQMDRGASHLQC